jgi:hypothetical protein
MSNTKKTKGATLTQQIDKLEKLVGPTGADAARKMIAGNQRNIVKLAAKYLGLERASRDGLTVRQHGTYQELAAKNQQLADEWKADRVKENLARKAKKSQKAVETTA